MRKKRKNLWKIIKGIRKQSICMQQRLIVYWCVVILTLFSAAVLLMSILGVIPGMDLKVGEMLSAQQKNTVSAMTEQTDIMMARSISLSEEITKELSQYLTANGKAFSDLNDNPQLIMDLEAALYSSLRSALDVKYCSGVFVILNATVNTETEYADTSRMGIYLRLSDLKAVNTSKQHVVFFRGNAYIARAEQVQLHNRWNLEFAQTEGYMGRCTAFICAGFRQHRKSAGAVWYGDEQSIFQTFLSYGRRILWKYGDSSGSNGRKRENLSG